MATRAVTRALAFSLFVLALNTGYVASRNLIPEAALGSLPTLRRDRVLRQMLTKADGNGLWNVFKSRSQCWDPVALSTKR
ncbi:peptide-n4-(N-acetyl-betaglucosaminyl) asparagine amidase a [Colletotrichum higginsianum]|nr:peptide-n4-(N-acetyl-betaglucosaminyl) asparagine amidase a [Colletotrichum higginsianum]